MCGANVFSAISAFSTCSGTGIAVTHDDGLLLQQHRRVLPYSPSSSAL
jgi:hypothetical protein